MSANGTLNGNITDTGGENADFRGFVWDTVTRADPGDTAPGVSAYSDNWTEGGSFGTGAFSHQITGLTEGATYYVRACAHNSAAWAYGGEVSFIAPKSISSAGAIGTVEALGSLVVAGPIIANGIASVEAIGALEVASGIAAEGIASVEALGSPVIAGPIIAVGIGTVEALGTPLLTLYLLPSGIASVEGLENPQVNLWVHPDGVVSVEGLGDLIIAGPIIAVGIGTVEGLGTPSIPTYVYPSGIASVQGLGTPFLTMYAFPTLADALGFILEARNSSGDLLAILQNAFEIGLVEEINRPPMLDFKIPSDDGKLAHVIPANELWLRNYKTGTLLYKFLLSNRKDIRV